MISDGNKNKYLYNKIGTINTNIYNKYNTIIFLY